MCHLVRKRFSVLGIENQAILVIDAEETVDSSVEDGALEVLWVGSDLFAVGKSGVVARVDVVDSTSSSIATSS